MDKVDIAVQTVFEEELQQHEKSDIPESCEEVKEDGSEKNLDYDFENNTNPFVQRNLCGIPRTNDNYAACRLANPFMPSPLLERRTIL